MTQDTFIQTLPTDPLIAPVIEGLFGEYRRRYGDYFGDREPEPLDLYAPPQGPSSCCCAPVRRSPWAPLNAMTHKPPS